MARKTPGNDLPEAPESPGLIRLNSDEDLQVKVGSRGRVLWVRGEGKEEPGKGR